MFEKEANAYKEIVMKEYLRNPFPRSVEDVWQDGAEFGYNKANEWHYVKDGDLPEEEGEYLVIFESDGTKYKGLESYYPDTKEWSTICKIIAWKEIVLPKESE